jgi:DNA invertase Pin-like site-specific DNA recombinase
MHTNTIQKRAVIFMRAQHLGLAGRDEAAENRSIEDQRDRCLIMAAEQGAEVVREYIEHGGAGRIDKRPVLRLLLDELCSLRDVDYVIVTSHDRLARRTDDWACLDLELEAASAELVIAPDGYHEVRCGTMSGRIPEGLIDA